MQFSIEKKIVLTRKITDRYIWHLKESVKYCSHRAMSAVR
jgi:hypothetical protein